jgi:hypothetical protein
MGGWGDLIVFWVGRAVRLKGLFAFFLVLSRCVCHSDLGLWGQDLGIRC